jgi:hypothetical protein
MTEGKLRWKVLACGCALGYERCFDCRPGLHPDQETALAMTLKECEEALERELMHINGELPRSD